MSKPPAHEEAAVSAPPDPAPGRPRDGMPAAVVAACPYLAVEGRAWRSATADREHRCTAIVPPAALALDKQRRLCLGGDHVTCATYLAAMSAHPIVSSADDFAARHVTRWAIPRTTPVVIDRGRLPSVVTTLSPFRRGGQLALGGLMAVAFAAVLSSRISSPDGRPVGAAGATASASLATSTAVRMATPRPTVAATTRPSIAPTPSPAQTEVPSTAPTAAPTPLSYTVRSGDTLSAIAARFNTSVSAIQTLNGISDPRLLRVGQVLKIPPAPIP